jgi:hypothetical protein
VDVSNTEDAMSKYSQKQAARDTNSNAREARRAWHDARDHAAGSGHLRERNHNKTQDSSEGAWLGKFFRKIGLTK